MYIYIYIYIYLFIYLYSRSHGAAVGGEHRPEEAPAGAGEEQQPHDGAKTTRETKGISRNSTKQQE